jgi:3-oxoacyl-[acyl-carrier-protein] synthase-3
MTKIRAVAVGCGSYLPSNTVSNDDLRKQGIDTTDEWIQSRTGIKRRHFAADHEKTSDLAIQAASRALDHAGLLGSDIDCIILATCTPDETFPATAVKIQAAIGMKGGFAMDVAAVCTGFIFAMNVARNFIEMGQVNRALVIGAETLSRILDWEDRTTCVLFGDGAGALILEAQEQEGTIEDRGILTCKLHSDGTKHDLLHTDGGPSSTQTTGHIRMLGREVFRHAVVNLASVLHEVIDQLELTPDDIDWVVPHQANKRILEATTKKFKIPKERVVVTVEEHANTSAASIPLALDLAVKDGRITKGDLVLLEGMGGGFTWGAGIIRW